MPYKQRDAWHRQMREYLGRKEADLKPSSYMVYRTALETCGELLGHPNPGLVPLEEMRRLDREYPWAESTAAGQLRICKDFLIKSGNREAEWWAVHRKYMPASDSVWLTEEEAERAERAAFDLGLLHRVHLAITLNEGLRPYDARQLTVRNGLEAVRQRTSMILGKGRNGGKIALQVFSLNTQEILREYLDYRVQLVEASGMDYDHLLIRPRKLKREQARQGDPILWDYPFQRRLQAEIVETSGIRPWKIKDSRKSCGRFAWQYNGENERAAANILRHEQPDTSFKWYIGIPQVVALRQIDRVRVRKPCPAPLVQISQH